MYINKTILQAKQLCLPELNNELRQFVLNCKIFDKFKNFCIKEP